MQSTEIKPLNMDSERVSTYNVVPWDIQLPMHMVKS